MPSTNHMYKNVVQRKIAFYSQDTCWAFLPQNEKRQDPLNPHILG